MKQTPELTIITKTYNLILWSCHHTSRFPRNHRFVLGERIERHLYELLEMLMQAKYTRQRQGLLEKAKEFAQETAQKVSETIQKSNERRKIHH